MQDGSPVTSLTPTEAFSQLTALGPQQRGGPTRLVAALRQQVGTVPSILRTPGSQSVFMINGSPSPPGLRPMLLAQLLTMHIL